MTVISLEQIIPELRDAIGPVILISGVGSLLLTMTNRLGRAIDRARQKIQFLIILPGNYSSPSTGDVPFSCTSSDFRTNSTCTTLTDLYPLIGRYGNLCGDVVNVFNEQLTCGLSPTLPVE